MQERDKIENGLFIAGWCLVGAGIIFWLLLILTDFRLGKILLPCVFHLATGHYCPGCGGTRAVLALLKGHPIQSFLYHPFVLYAVVIGGWFLISQSIERLSKGKIPIAMRYRDGYLWFSLVIIGLNFCIKNVVLILTGVDLLKVLG